MGVARPSQAAALDPEQDVETEGKWKGRTVYFSPAPRPKGRVRLRSLQCPGVAAGPAGWRSGLRRTGEG